MSFKFVCTSNGRKQDPDSCPRPAWLPGLYSACLYAAVYEGWEHSEGTLSFPQPYASRTSATSFAAPIRPHWNAQTFTVCYVHVVVRISTVFKADFCERRGTAGAALAPSNPTSRPTQ